MRAMVIIDARQRGDRYNYFIIISVNALVFSFVGHSDSINQ